MARLYRDSFGIPHVRGTDVLDLAHGQGEVTARDRTWQLEFQRRRATGTTAEAFGTAGLPWDRLVRRTRVADYARRAHARLEPNTQAFVAAYVDGVNAGLDPDAPELRALDLQPVAWEPWTPLAVFLGQHLLFAGLGPKLFNHRAREVLGEDAELLTREGPDASGSNAWVAGGARTASGMPLIGGDPHRVIESPGVYHQVRLACEGDDGFDVVGFAFPGVPGVQHFAHAGEVAWAITNAMADYQDVYAERLHRVGDVVEARGPNGWEPVSSHIEEIAVRDGAPEPVEVVTTARGAVFSGEVDEGHGLALRTASGVLEDLGFDALLPLLRARSVADVDAALDRWVEPVNNAVVADRAGRVLYRIAGRVPLRSEANRQGIVPADDPGTGWTGWVDLPRHEVRADGTVITANERRGPESEPIGTAFAAPHRAARLAELIGDRTDLDAAAFASFHGDVRLGGHHGLLDLLRTLEPTGAGAGVRAEVEGWDGEMQAGSTGAAAFAAWRGALARRVAAEPVFAKLWEPVVDDPVLAGFLDPAARIGGSLEALVAAGTPFGIDLADLATKALDDAADHPATWGESHVVTPLHAFDVVATALGAPTLPVLPVGGDNDCVRCTGTLPGLDDTCWRGSVARYVWDLADPEAGGWVVPLGASGDERSPHHSDQLALWADVRLVPIVTAWDRLVEGT